ncbi:hypothetical protein [Paenibacillus tuaregi]|uniref:hypothetical protein n=1 Tax=Paenibacillus tuaregi TaxID=1816681 RepID=UPI000838BDE7|nr:hypothetical protein [Paenibacillus tuaregi]
MDFKAVELQIAVPRTSEASRIQQEAQHSPMHHQHTLEGQNMKRSDRERKRSAQVDESSQAVVRDGRQSSSGEAGQQDKQEASSEQVKEHPAEHPFKGHNFDLSL